MTEPAPPTHTRYLLRGWLLLLVAAALLAPAAHAQNGLTRVDNRTTVGSIEFSFPSTRTFEEGRLKEQMALTEPSFFDRVRDFLPLFAATEHPFDPITLQKDIVRLRSFYNENGFLEPRITYEGSSLDSTDNTIDLDIRIEEGPPLIIQDVLFEGPGEMRYAVQQFEGDVRDDWIEFRDENTFDRGSRFTRLRYVELGAKITSWLRDEGFAFPRVSSDSTVYARQNTIDIRFQVDSGPRTTIDSIRVVGNTSVDDEVVLRELPFGVGDRFSGSDLLRGQRELFALNLFRLAVVTVPDQPRDSTVMVSVRVQEADLRYMTAQTGYASSSGLILEGSWSHRNFLGDARNLTLSSEWRTGYGATATRGPALSRRLRLGLSLRQPYLFTTSLSGAVEPFYLRQNDVLFQGTEYGLNTNLIYQIYRFRILALEHSFSRNITERVDLPRFQRSLSNTYTRSSVSLSATLGKADDYLYPSEGFLIRPSFGYSGPLTGSQTHYYRFALSASAYYPLPNDWTLGGRLTASRLLLGGESRYNERAIFTDLGFITADCAGQGDPACVNEIFDNIQLESRFDRLRFYAGGGSDVRGWPLRLLGPTVVTADTTFQRDEEGRYRYIDGEPVPALNEEGEVIRSIDYEGLGGLAKFAFNLELRFPLTWPTNDFSGAIFLDGGQVGEGFSGGAEGAALLSRLRFGTGAGVRYETPVGAIRLDVGYKINPAPTDLVDADDWYAWEAGELDERPRGNVWDRFNIHLSIGQAF